MKSLEFFHFLKGQALSVFGAITRKVTGDLQLD